jgi:hypothetical protein
MNSPSQSNSTYQSVYGEHIKAFIDLKQKLGFVIGKVKRFWPNWTGWQQNAKRQLAALPKSWRRSGDKGGLTNQATTTMSELDSCSGFRLTCAIWALFLICPACLGLWPARLFLTSTPSKK